MADFEVFTRRMVPLVKQPTATLQKRGTMSLNKAAHVALGSPDAVELLYDRAEQIIGMSVGSCGWTRASAYAAMRFLKPATLWANSGESGASFCSARSWRVQSSVVLMYSLASEIERNA